MLHSTFKEKLTPMRESHIFAWLYPSLWGECRSPATTPTLKVPPPSESGHPLLGGRPTLSRCLIYFRQKETTGEAKKRWSLVKKFNISRKHFSAKSLSTKKNVHVGKCKCKWIVASGSRPRMSWHYCFPLNGRSLELLTLSAAFPDAPEFALTSSSLPHQDSCLNISRRDKVREFSSCSI